MLSELSSHTGAQVSQRGSEILVSGDPEGVGLAMRFLEDATRLLDEGLEMHVADVAHSIRGLRADPERTLVDLLDQVILMTPRRRPIAPKTAAQRHYIANIRRHSLTFGIGPAGTGKTYLAMAMAASALIKRKVKRLVLTRPAVEAGERLGFLPGDLAEKVNPYLRPLYDALNDMLDYDKIQQMRSQNQIEVAPLAFMRGRTLNDCFVILDEAQNATADQMKMFLTRLGHGSTAVVTGDITQTDLPRGLCAASSCNARVSVTSVSRMILTHSCGSALAASAILRPSRVNQSPSADVGLFNTSRTMRCHDSPASSHPKISTATRLCSRMRPSSSMTTTPPGSVASNERRRSAVRCASDVAWARARRASSSSPVSRATRSSKA
jgi:phosphate starvation-inducible PhoH-like protein